MRNTERGLFEYPLLYTVAGLALAIALGVAYHFFVVKRLEHQVADLQVQLTASNQARDAALGANSAFKAEVEGLNAKIDAAVAERDASDKLYLGAKAAAEKAGVDFDKKIAGLRAQKPLTANQCASVDNLLTTYFKDRKNVKPQTAVPVSPVVH